jgi:hypothetical protein
MFSPLLMDWDWSIGETLADEAENRSRLLVEFNELFPPTNLELYVIPNNTSVEFEDVWF